MDITKFIRTSELRSDTPLEAVVNSFHVSTRISPTSKTGRFYQTHFRGFARFLRATLGREPVLSDLNRDYANAYVGDLEARPTPSYPKGSPFRARAAAVSLKRLANWMAEEKIVAESPLRSLRKPKELRDVRQPLSDEELERVLFGAGRPGQRDHALVALMAATGLRLNEARELRVGDVSLRDCQLTVRAETSKVCAGRTVDFHADVARELDRYLRERPGLNDDAPLFPTDGGRVFTTDGFTQLFRRIAQRSGVRRFHAHLLRHTWATNWMRPEGANLLELKRQGGWEKMEMVERYSKGSGVRDRASLPNPLNHDRVVPFRREALH